MGSELNNSCQKQDRGVTDSSEEISSLQSVAISKEKEKDKKKSVEIIRKELERNKQSTAN